MVIFVPPVHADTPTVTITDYKVTPSVLMPDSMGTITVTIKNTAASATISEKTGPLSSDTAGTTTGNRHQCQYRECPSRRKWH